MTTLEKILNLQIARLAITVLVCINTLTSLISGIWPIIFVIPAAIFIAIGIEYFRYFFSIKGVKYLFLNILLLPVLGHFVYAPFIEIITTEYVLALWLAGITSLELLPTVLYLKYHEEL